MVDSDTRPWFEQPTEHLSIGQAAIAELTSLIEKTKDVNCLMADLSNELIVAIAKMRNLRICASKEPSNKLAKRWNLSQARISQIRQRKGNLKQDLEEASLDLFKIMGTLLVMTEHAFTPEEGILYAKLHESLHQEFTLYQRGLKDG